MKQTKSRPHDKWGKIQREALKYLKGNDLRVYADLLTYADSKSKCFPSVETIGKDLLLHPRNVQKHLANLERDGWIKKHLRTNTSTIYQLYFVMVNDTTKPAVKKSSSSDGMVKSTASEVVKRTASGVAKSTVSGVADSTTLTDHLTDQYNKPQEQGIADCTNIKKLSDTDTYHCTDEERSRFNNLWSQYSVQSENEGSAFAAWRKYCSYDNPLLINKIEFDLKQKSKSGTYMTTIMKHAHNDYLLRKKEQMDNQKLAEMNKKNPEQQL